MNGGVRGIFAGCDIPAKSTIRAVSSGRGAGGDGADGGNLVLARGLGEFRHRLGSACDGIGLELSRFIKTLAEARLAAYHRGEVTSLDGPTVLRELRGRYRK